MNRFAAPPAVDTRPATAFAPPPEPTPAPTTERETLGAAARRHGMSYHRLWCILSAAGVFVPGSGTVGALLVLDIDRAVAAHLRTHHPARRASSGAGPSTPPHVPSADGRVGCESCWSIATLTRGRITVCRWCRGSATW